jgi:hypothetical protein
MMPIHVIFRTCLAVTLIALTACGGGGGSGGGGSAFPSSGAYGWILKANGATNALEYGLSLVHPSKPDTEYVIEAASAVGSDARLVVAGSVDATNARTTGNTAYALVYVVGGDVRSVPMVADGTAPSTRVQRAQTTSACAILIEANDYAQPQDSRYIVSTAGPDGSCGTADDGRAELRLSATGVLGFTPLSGDAPLDLVRDAATMAPRGWIYPRNVTLWTTTPATTIATRTAPATPITGVLASTYSAVLVQDGARLSVLTFPTAATVSETPLDASLTAGGNWQLIGYDASDFFVYLNGGSFTSPWTVLKISRSNPTATLVASGTGQVTSASMGSNMLYLTVFGQDDNQLLRIAKTGGIAAQGSTATTTLKTVTTSAGGVHQRWTVTGVGSSTPGYTIDFIDESDGVLSSVASAFPMTLAEADSLSFNASETRTLFLVAGNYGSHAFRDASLVAYDAAARTVTTLGALPGVVAFGSNDVFASALAGPGRIGLGFAARSVNGSLSDVGAKVFSYDPGVANSLKFATSQQ